MQPFHLIIPFKDFSEQINNLINRVEPFKSKKYKTKEEQSELYVFRSEWENDLQNLLQNSFSLSQNSLFKFFKGIKVDRLGIPNHQHHEEIKANRIKDGIVNKLKELDLLLTIVEASDYIITPKQEILDKNKNLTIKEKDKLILDKLYRLRKRRIEDYVSIDLIAETNFIVFDTSNEKFEIIRSLQERKLIDSFNNQPIVRISAGGVRLIEENIENYQTQNNFSTDENKFTKEQIQNLNEKIDTLINEFKIQGLANEILFNELQDLKDYLNILHKKNWGEMFRGKILDMAMGKIVEPEILTKAYETITGTSLSAIPLREHIKSLIGM